MAYDNRGITYRDKGLYDPAIADETRAIARVSDDASAYNNRAWDLHKKGEDATGLPDANKAIALAPKDANSIETRAEIYEKLGQRDLAVADYRAALKLNPAMQEALDGLKRLDAAQPPRLLPGPTQRGPVFSATAPAQGPSGPSLAAACARKASR